MKKINLLTGLAILLLVCIFVIAINSCVKEAPEPEVEPSGKALSIMSLIFNTIEEDEVDASLSIDFNESIQPVLEGGYHFGCGASFRHNGNNIDAGDLTLNGQAISFNTSEIRYLESFMDAHMERTFVPGDSLNITLSARATKDYYDSFTTTVITPGSLNTRVTLNGTGRTFDKNKNIKLEWDADPNYPTTYFVLCQIGNPCIVKQVDSGTSLTVNKHEYSFLDTDKLLHYYLARGVQDCFKNNDKDVCYNLAVIARRVGIEVIDSGSN